MKTNPDVSSILRQKSERRRRQAGLTFEEKIAIVKKWQEVTKEIKKSRAASLSSAQTFKTVGDKNHVE